MRSHPYYVLIILYQIAYKLTAENSIPEYQVQEHVGEFEAWPRFHKQSQTRAQAQLNFLNYFSGYKSQR